MLAILHAETIWLLQANLKGVLVCTPGSSAAVRLALAYVIRKIWFRIPQRDSTTGLGVSSPINSVLGAKVFDSNQNLELSCQQSKRVRAI